MCKDAHFYVHLSVGLSMIDDDSILCSYEFLDFPVFGPTGRLKKHGIEIALLFCMKQYRSSRISTGNPLMVS